MKRREAIKNISLMLGAFAFTPALIQACKNFEDEKKIKGLILSKDQSLCLEEIADTMFPSTAQSPGAKVAGIGKVMTTIIKDCYTYEDGKKIQDGIIKINTQSQQQFKQQFVELIHQDKVKILSAIDESNNKPEYINLLKELSVYTYFTSEIGMTKARRYIEVPGRYDGCMPYKKGDRGWSWSFFVY